MHMKGALAALAVGAMALAACSSGGGGSSSSSAAPSTSSAPTSSAAPNPYKPIRVALLTPGTANDGSWGQAVSTGTKEAVDKVGGELTISEDLNEASDYEQAGNAFGAEGFDLVINANASMIDVTNKLAEKYPDTKWGQVGLIDSPMENQSARLPILWNGTFVAGYLAGKMTKTNKLGTIGGFEFPALTSEMEGFALGARYANPDVTTERVYINTWTDTAIAATAAEAQKANGADIIFSATDQATQGIFKVMGESPDHYVIAQYLDKHDQAPDVVLTSVLYGLQGICGNFVLTAASDTWEANSATTNWGEGMELAPYYNLESKISPEIRAEVDEIKAKLENGQIVLPGLDVLGVTGSADTVDLKSLDVG